MYWPKEGLETYGIIQVKFLQEVVMATYTLRTFTVKNLKVKKVRTKLKASLIDVKACLKTWLENVNVFGSKAAFISHFHIVCKNASKA